MPPEVPCPLAARSPTCTARPGPACRSSPPWQRRLELVRLLLEESASLTPRCRDLAPRLLSALNANGATALVTAAHYTSPGCAAQHGGHEVFSYLLRLAGRRDGLVPMQALFRKSRGGGWAVPRYCTVLGRGRRASPSSVQSLIQ